MIGLLRESMYESMLVVTQWVGHRRDGLIPCKTVSGKEVWMSGKQGEWCRIGVNDRGL